jgi:hypothetical protein
MEAGAHADTTTSDGDQRWDPATTTSNHIGTPVPLLSSMYFPQILDYLLAIRVCR